MRRLPNHRSRQDTVSTRLARKLAGILSSTAEPLVYEPPEPDANAGVSRRRSQRSDSTNPQSNATDEISVPHGNPLGTAALPP